MEPKMTDLSSEWMPGSFYRRPEWRWLRAQYLHDTGRRMDGRIDDAKVAQTRKALSLRRGKRSKADSIHDAYEVWAGDAMQRGKLEARLLTDESGTAIAAKVGLPCCLVEAYSAIFFDVRGMKSAIHWLHHQAIGYSPFGGFTGPMPFAAWKLAGLVGGPIWLDMTIRATTATPLPIVLPTDLGISQLAEMRTQRMVELWIKMVDAPTATKFQELIRDYRLYRDWVTTVTGIPCKVSPTMLLYERFLLRLDHDDVPTTEQPGWSEPEMVPHSGQTSPLRTHALARNGLGNATQLPTAKIVRPALVA